MSPNDNRLSGNQAGKVGDFGANRAAKPTSVQKAEDYTKANQERRANLDGEVESELIVPETTMDIDDMNDPNVRKREESRRAETSTVGAQNQYRRPGDSDKIQSDSDKRTAPDTRSDSVVAVPDPEAKHGSRNPYSIGEDHDKRGDQNTGPMTKPR
jgi:hypothetical protein